MYVGVCKLTLMAPGCHSLKDKRSVVRRVKDRVSNKFAAAIAEVGANDLWQRIELGVAVVSGDFRHAEQMVDHIATFVDSLGVAQVVGDDREVIQFGDSMSGEDALMASKYGIEVPE